MEQLTPFDLSPHQYRALAALARSTMHDGGHCEERPKGMRLSEIAERLRIAPRSATEVIDLLEAKLLVRRDPDPADRRATRVNLTQQGQRLYGLIRSERLTQAQEFFAVLGEADRAELSRLLDLLIEAHPRC